jgi:hypothetical protein
LDLDTSKTPHHIDIGIDSRRIRLLRADGVKQVQFSTMKGIFELHRHPTDRSEDTLRWCFSMPNEPRPTDFSVKTGSGYKLIEMKRFVSKEDAATKLQKAAVKSLRLADTQNTAKVDIQYSKSKNQVESVTLENMSDPKKTLSIIHDLGKLRDLTIDVANNEIAERLVGQPSLRTLSFQCEVPPSTMKIIAGGLLNLHTIEFKCPNFTAEHGKALAASNSLRTVTISDNEQNISGLVQLADARIWSLRFRDSKVDKRCIETIANSLRRLNSLELQNCEIDEEDFSSVSQIKTVRNLGLIDCDIADEGIRNLGILPKLQYIDISGTSVTNSTMETLLKNFPRLHGIDAKNTGFNKEIIPILESADRRIQVLVSESSITNEQLESASERVASIIRIDR